MNDAYEDFKAEREEARSHMRAAIARQTLDTSDRGHSVRHALRLYRGMDIHNMGRTESARYRQTLVRMAWNQAYRTARKQDAAARKVQAQFFRDWASLADELLKPRKIDELLWGSTANELLGRPE